ncbi:MAG: hypothetical protein U9P79_04725 [Candidatus Cloacimonadota bacterium]|nr:hypothetical protein [Candidatus Cloacimonadota bacterium]
MPEKDFTGLQIVGFYENSQLLETGVEEGDWIVEYNGEPITNSNQIDNLKVQLQTSQNIILTIRKADGDEEYYEILPGDLGVYLTEVKKNPKVLPDARRIENIDRLEKKTGMENSLFYSIHNIFKYFDLHLELEQIFVFSAYPFRCQFASIISKNVFDPTEGFDSASFLFDNLDIKYRQFDTTTSSKKKIHNEIIKSVDNDLPVLSRNCFNNQEWGIIAGYQDNKSKFFTRSFLDNTIEYSIAPNFPNKIIILEEVPDISCFEENDYAEQHKNCLIKANKIINLDNFGKFFLGNESIRQWINFLENEEYFIKLDAAEFDKICMNHKEIFANFQINCTIAMNYFESLVDKFPESKEHLRRLKKFFRAESKILFDCQKKIPFIHDKGLQDIWTENARKKQSIALTKILKKNREILAVLGKLPLIQ